MEPTEKVRPCHVTGGHLTWLGQRPALQNILASLAFSGQQACSSALRGCGSFLDWGDMTKPDAPLSGWTHSFEKPEAAENAGTLLFDAEGRKSPRNATARYPGVKWIVVALLISLWALFRLHERTQWHCTTTSTGGVASCTNNVLGTPQTSETTGSDEHGPSKNLTLAPFTFSPLPLGSIKPRGWIKDQMVLMAHGLAGNQFEFYHLVRNSPWLGGNSEYSVLNEGLPYWFNGLVPLAYSLNDTRLIRQVEDASDLVLNHQQLDGWLGPEIFWSRDLWARFPFCLGLIQLAEGDPSRAPKIVSALYRFVDLMHRMLIENIGFDQIWGRVRFADMILTLQWLYETYPENNKDLLLETMYLLKERSLDWTQYWTKKEFIFGDLDRVQPPITADSEVFPFVHGVNAVQGLKTGAVLNRFLFNSSLIEIARRAVNWTLTYHGDPAGSVLGDERESSLAPNRGTELCTTVELMFSLSYLYQATGDKYYADRCELAAFNALPVSITSDHWKRQYLNVPNEPWADQLSEPTPFWNVGRDGLIYGLERNYPCCTVNMPQGLPKFLSASFVLAGDNGVAHALLGPASVSTTTAAGTAVSIRCNTPYPFGSVLQYSISASAPFTLFLRVPSWHIPQGSSIDVIYDDDKSNRKPVSHPLKPDAHTGMTAISLPGGNSTIVYRLAAALRIEPRGNDSVSIYHGALLYALDVGQTVASMPVLLFNATYTYPEADGPPRIPDHVHDVTYAAAEPWNMAIDPSTVVFHASSEIRPAEPLTNPIYEYGGPPSYVTAKACQIHWEKYRGLPAPLPKLPEGAVWKCIGNVTDVILRPYGSLKIHMAELPTVDLSPGSASLSDIPTSTRDDQAAVEL